MSMIEQLNTSIRRGPVADDIFNRVLARPVRPEPSAKARAWRCVEHDFAGCTCPPEHRVKPVVLPEDKWEAHKMSEKAYRAAENTSYRVYDRGLLRPGENQEETGRRVKALNAYAAAVSAEITRRGW